MNYLAVKDSFGSFAPLLREYIEGDGLDTIFRYLKEMKGKGREIYPESKDVFRTFREIDKDKVRCIVYMMDPYPTKKDNIIIANGIPMSCENTGMLQPSLEYFYQAIEHEYLAFDPNMDLRPDCSYLLREEGVLLINSSLTVEALKVGSHSQLWEPFQKWFIENVINVYYKGLPIVLCGESAQRLEKYFNPMLHYIHKTSHPASVGHSGGSKWNTKMFSFINTILESNNGYGIRWWRKKGEDDIPLPEFVTSSSPKREEDDIESDLPWSKKK